MEKMFTYAQGLLYYAKEELSGIDGLQIAGFSPHQQVTPFHIGENNVKLLEKCLSDDHNIFVRAGDLSARR